MDKFKNIFIIGRSVVNEKFILINIRGWEREGYVYNEGGPPNKYFFKDLKID